MTPKQRELLDFIDSYIAKNRYAPTYREMVEAAGLKSKSGIRRLIDGLVDQGQLRVRRFRQRGIERTNPLATIPSSALRAELVGRGEL